MNSAQRLKIRNRVRNDVFEGSVKGLRIGSGTTDSDPDNAGSNEAVYFKVLVWASQTTVF